MTIFDIVGPVMIGPSSSHTAGAARIGGIARSLLGEKPVTADILLHGSFAKTYKGHGTDKALIAGILGLTPEDSRIRSSIELADAQGLAVKITTGVLEGAHPNSVAITLTGDTGNQVSLEAASVGGGNVRITKINQMSVDISGHYDTLIVLHEDTPGTIAKVTELMAGQQINICNFHLSRQSKGGIACMTIEVDSHMDSQVVTTVGQLPQVIQTTLLRAM